MYKYLVIQLVQKKNPNKDCGPRSKKAKPILKPSARKTPYKIPCLITKYGKKYLFVCDMLISKLEMVLFNIQNQFIPKKSKT